MSVSVVVATYNGEKYVKEQIESICMQLSDDDELIVTDDGSTDDTIDIINQLIIKYNMIKIINGPMRGVSANFENGILNTKHDFVFLSDQDDIWVDGKINEVVHRFEANPGVSLILHDAYEMSEEIINYKKTLLSERKYKKGVINNTIKSSYYGCCMAFRRDFIKTIIPFPNNLVAHDQFIGVLGELNNNVLYVDKPLIVHRFHSSNISKKQRLISKILFRVRLLLNVVYHYRGV